jgi:hypothetical protein
MKIEQYSFGRITIDGKAYTSDLIIYPDRIDDSWWRKEGHLLQMDDVKDVLKAKPEVLIIGTGNSGFMKVSDKFIDELKSKGIDVYAAKTQEAVSLFNKISLQKKTVACLHLTC